MHFENLLRAGLAVFGIAALALGRDGLLYVAAAAVILPLAWLQRSATALAKDVSDARRVHALALGLQLVATLVLVWARPVAGTAVFAGGGLLNMLALLANGLRMPTRATTDHPCYCDIGPKTRLRWLGDIFVASRTATTLWMFSVGDMLEMLGLWAVAAHLTVRLVA